MLYSLGFLAEGNSWPPEGEGSRLKKYRNNRLLWEGDHALVFEDSWRRLVREDHLTSYEITDNWFAAVSLLWADLAVGEKPEIRAGGPDSAESEAVARLIKDNSLTDKLWSACIDLSRYGDAVFKLWKPEGEGAVIDVISPALWFPIVSADDVQDVQYHVLAWTRDYDKDSEELYVEIHSRGSIEVRRFILDHRNEIVRQIEKPQVTYTGVDDFLVIPVPNIRTSDKLFGMDDYSKFQSQVCELEVREAQISRILDKHADPNMHGPRDALTQNPETGEWELNLQGRYFPRNQGEDPPGYITWDGQLLAAESQIKRLEEKIYRNSETTPAAFALAKEGYAESGTALRLRLTPCLKHAERLQNRLDKALKHIIPLAAQLERKNGMTATPEITADMIDITWQDGLPNDYAEDARIANESVAVGTMSVRRKLSTVDGLEGDSLETEIEEIQSGQTVEEPAISLPGLEEEE